MKATLGERPTGHIHTRSSFLSCLPKLKPQIRAFAPDGDSIGESDLLLPIMLWSDPGHDR